MIDPPFSDDSTNDEQSQNRMQDFNNYEINKYMRKDIKPIHMPKMTQFKRAEDNDPGQSSPRATMEANIIKNLIISYFDTVRK